MLVTTIAIKKKSFSRINVKFVIEGYDIKDCVIVYDKIKQYEDFIIGIDENDNTIMFTLIH